jgi:phenylacetic acid degradation operon negative regulatory protein
MKAKTELLLYRLDWLVGKALTPGWRSLESSFESWAYGKGLLRQIQRLEAEAYLEMRRDEVSGERLVRLTERGVKHCQGGFDPEGKWGMKWDGKWRMVIFDVPELNRPLRAKLRKRLIDEKFGCLQQSVWITPRPCEQMINELRGAVVEGSALTLMEGIPVGGESAADLVRSAWDFERIHEAWQRASDHLGLLTADMVRDEPAAVWKWLEEERRLIRRCAVVDPLLPAVLLPKGYKGNAVWKKRKEVLADLAVRMG